MRGKPLVQRIFTSALLLAVTLAIPHQVIADTVAGPEPVLVDDIRADARDSDPAELTAVGNAIFFRANDGLSGEELWMVAPPYNNARLVADVCAGGCSSTPTNLTALGSTLFFSASDQDNGIELWYSEPPYNQSSTFRVGDINPGGDASPREIIPIGDAVFFSADDGSGGRELWKASPPFQTAVQVKDIRNGAASSDLHDLTSVGWMLFFAADDSSGEEIWRSDPPYTAASTFRVTNINPDGGAAVQELTRMQLKLFFSADDGKSGQELWLLESPYQEARRVTDVTGNALSSAPHDFYVLDDLLFFTANINFTGPELFKSRPDYDSTTTTLVKEIRANFFGSEPSQKYAIGSTLFFAANDGIHGNELWKTTPEYVPDTTEIVLDIWHGAGSSQPANLTSIGTTLYFTAGDGKNGYELWKSAPPYDDTTTSRVSDLSPGSGSSNPGKSIFVQNSLFFAAHDDEKGRELFHYGGYSGIPNTGFAPNRVTVIDSQPAEKAYFTLDTLRLDIPAASVKTEVVGVPPSVDGWDLDWLSTQAGYLSGTAFPTHAGNSVLTAHVYLPDGSPGPFVNLHRVKYGDRVSLFAWGQRYIYEVRAVQTISPQDSPAVFQHEELPWLTLVTCQGYDPQTNRYNSRLVVRAVLLKVENAH